MLRSSDCKIDVANGTLHAGIEAAPEGLKVSFCRGISI
jgi:hypothetical protein